MAEATVCGSTWGTGTEPHNYRSRSEEHTSELQSRSDLVCRLLLEKKKQETANTWDLITDPPKATDQQPRRFCERRLTASYPHMHDHESHHSRTIRPADEQCWDMILRKI